MSVTASTTPLQHRPAPAGTSATWRAALPVAALVVVTFEGWRLLFPHVYGLKERAGLATTAAVALAAGAAGVAAVPLRRLVGARAVTFALVGLGLWRAACLLTDPVPLALAVVGSALASTALVLVVMAPVPGTGAGLLAGLVLDVVVMASFASWDPVWQRTPASAAVGLALAAALVAGVRSRGAPAPRLGAPIGAAAGVAVGSVAMLELSFLDDPAFLAAGGRSYPAAVAVAAGGVAALALGVLLHRVAWRAAVPFAAVVLASAGWALATASGGRAVALLLVAQLAVGVVMAAALAPRARTRPLASALGLASGLAVPVAGTLLYQLHYDAPLPFDNRMLVLAAGLATALAAWARPEPPTSRRLAPPTPLGWAVAGGLVVAGLVAPLVLAVTAPDPAAATATTMRVVQLNVRQAVADDGALDPEAIAAAIEAQGPVDVVVLNEVGRGWPLSGQLDLATWLSRRLDRRVAWAGAASDQFGNLVLSRLPVERTLVTTLPVVDRNQGRSALAVTVRLDGTEVVVVATHLQHHNDATSMAVRLAQVRELVTQWTGRDVVLAGDLNPRQGDPPAYPPRVPATFDEIRLLLDAGFTTAVDLSTCDTPTSNRNCSDYVFVGGTLRATSYAVVGGRGDHRMIVTDVARG